jgi:glycosyltransferase involved in cell wall biosynthesis
MRSSAVRALFINGGILGLRSFHEFLRTTLPAQSRIDGELLLLTDHVSIGDRMLRRLITQRFWRDGWFGVSNLDLARFRYELNAGLHARRRIARMGPERFDVLHFHRQAVAYGSLDLMRRIPSIVSTDCTQDCVIDGARTGFERATYALNARIDGAIFRRAAAIVATSEWAAASVRRRYPEAGATIHVLPNPVLLEHFDRRWLPARAARAAAGAIPRALFIGGDLPRKGGHDLLDAWTIGALHEEATLRIVSDWRIARALPPGVSVTTGVRPHTAAWRQCWSEADFFVMPTRNEAFGLVFQEAAAAGLPAIGTRHNAVPEIIEDGETGLLVPVGDPAALAEAMRRLARDASLRDRMGSRARDLIERRADPLEYLSRLTDIIEAAAGRFPPLR